MTRISLFLTLFVCLTAGCSKNTAWRPPLDGGHHIGGNEASMFAFGRTPDPGQSIVLYFPFGINSSTSHSHNPISRSFDYSGTITQSGDGPSLTYAISSEDPQILTLDGVRYDLSEGMVFRFDEDMSIQQYPFAGLAPSREYLDELSAYFTDSEDPEPTDDGTPQD